MNERPKFDEFELIAELFAPLSAGSPGAFGLTDDAAVISPAPGNTLVTTLDTIVAGVHFPDGSPGAEVARRLLRVNLSDLAAMGARPVAYLLGLAIAPTISVDWLRDFADGLAADQHLFGISLIGGDTTATPGPLTATVTALGEVPVDAVLNRSTARPDDLVFVSGTVGDAALGLRALEGALVIDDPADRDALIARYRLPMPRVALGPALRGLASACADVSDGLVADLGHICAASGVGAEIRVARVPLSPAARSVVADDPDLLKVALGGGDDYELVFTAPATAEQKILIAAAAAAGVGVTRIGRITAGDGVAVIDTDGAEILLDTMGYRHF